MDVAFRLKTVRKKRNLSVYRLAKLSGISQSFIGDIEAGRKSPTLYTLDKLCHALGVSLIELLMDEPPPGEPPRIPGPVPGPLQTLADEVFLLKPGQVELLVKFLQSFRDEDPPSFTMPPLDKGSGPKTPKY